MSTNYFIGGARVLALRRERRSFGSVAGSGFVVKTMRSFDYKRKTRWLNVVLNY